MADPMKLDTLRYAASMVGTFQQLHLLQDGSAPNFVAEFLTLFCKEGDRIIGELAKQLNKPSVDFDEVDSFVHQLEDSSACVGAQRVKNTCIQFHEFCQEKSRDGLYVLLGSMSRSTFVRLPFSNFKGA